MKRSLLSLLAGTLFLTACGPAEAIISVQLQSADGEPTPVGDLEVQLIPFNRDAVFDSLEAAYGTPQPEVPAEVLEAQLAIAAAQAEWQTQLQREADLREQLQGIDADLKQAVNGTAQYRLLFSDFNDVERQLNAASRAAEEAFGEFTDLQEANFAAADSIRVLRQAWAEDAFADFDAAWVQRIESTGLDVVVDTTDAAGVSRVAVDAGTYWVHARLTRVNDELYWNQMVEILGGEPFVVTLNLDNAESRPLI